MQDQSNSQQQASGTVKWYDDRKGFGFISPSNGGQDIFVHVSALERSGMNTLREGQKISYELQRDAKKGKDNAVNLREAG